MGIFCLAAGLLRKELPLTLAGAIFLAALAWLFLAVLLLSIVHRKAAKKISILIRQPAPGENAAIYIEDNGRRFFTLPGVVIRCSIVLKTLDGREIAAMFNPASGPSDLGDAMKRGAYYSESERVCVLDTPGFFRSYLQAGEPQSGPRLLVPPERPARESTKITIQSGGDDERREINFIKTDDFTDHRPYVPGDDPRKINWKLYGHSENLFVREGEPEPPPHSRLTILIDTWTDPAVFLPEAGRAGVDLLCSEALLLAEDLSARGTDIRLGYSGCGETIPAGRPEEINEFLAFPAAQRNSASLAELPDPVENRKTILLALPGTIPDTALDRFLARFGKDTDIVFFGSKDIPDEITGTAVRHYNHRSAAHARSQFR